MLVMKQRMLEWLSQHFDISSCIIMEIQLAIMNEQIQLAMNEQNR